MIRCPGFISTTTGHASEKSQVCHPFVDRCPVGRGALHWSRRARQTPYLSAWYIKMGSFPALHLCGVNPIFFSARPLIQPLASYLPGPPPSFFHGCSTVASSCQIIATE